MSTGKFITDSVAPGQTKPVPFLFDSSPEMFHSDTENTLHIGEEDSEDLFDNDDTYIEEFLEFEKTTFAETASSLPLPSERSAELQLQTTTTTIGKAPSGTTPVANETIRPTFHSPPLLSGHLGHRLSCLTSSPQSDMFPNCRGLTLHVFSLHQQRR